MNNSLKHNHILHGGQQGYKTGSYLVITQIRYYLKLPTDLILQNYMRFIGIRFNFCI